MIVILDAKHLRGTPFNFRGGGGEGGRGWVWNICRGQVIEFNPTRRRAEKFQILSHIYVEQFLKFFFFSCRVPDAVRLLYSFTPMVYHILLAIQLIMNQILNLSRNVSMCA